MNKFMKLEQLQKLLLNYMKVEKELGLDQIDDEEQLNIDIYEGMVGQTQNVEISNSNRRALNK